MNAVLLQQERIYDHINGSQSLCKWLSVASHEHSERYCIAKDTIQDTGEALLTHRIAGFHQDTSRRYIEYYGVLQAVFMQQDSIRELYKLFGPKVTLDFAKYPAWSKLRELRNDTVGHPVDRLKRLNRSEIAYERVNYQHLPSSNINSWSSIDIDLARELDLYEQEAAGILSAIATEMSNKCLVDHV